MNDEQRIKAAFHAGYIPPAAGFEEHVRSGLEPAPTPRFGGRVAAMVAVTLAVAVVAGLVAGPRIFNRSRLGGPSAIPSPAVSASPVVVGAEPVWIHMASASTGWVVTKTAVLRTVDGGSHWRDVSPPAAGTGTLAAWAFAGPAGAWMGVAGPSSLRVYATSDGGATWRQGPALTSPVGGAYLTFVDPRHGWLLIGLGSAAGSEGVVLYRTLDGASTWTQLATIVPGQDPGSSGLMGACQKTGLVFSDASHGWLSESCASSDRYLLQTSDGGVTWAPQSLPVSAQDATLGAGVMDAPPVFSTPSDGFAILSGPAPRLYSTADGGRTWQAGSDLIGAAPGLISSPSPGQFALVSGSDLLVSIDAGVHIATVHGNCDLANARAIDFPADLGTGWMVWAPNPSAAPGVYRTTDGGSTWLPVALTS